MSAYKRERTEDPIPADLNQFLTIEQRMTLNTIENFGWDLYFIRRPLFQEPIIIVKNHFENVHKQLEPDGTLITPNIVIREISLADE